MAKDVAYIYDPVLVLSAKNNTGSTIAAGTLVKLHSTEGEMVLPAGSSADARLFIVLADIPTGEYGSIHPGPGVFPGIASGALATPGAELMADNAGKLAAYNAGGAGNNRLSVGVQRGIAQNANDKLDFFFCQSWKQG